MQALNISAPPDEEAAAVACTVPQYLIRFASVGNDKFECQGPQLANSSPLKPV